MTRPHCPQGAEAKSDAAAGRAPLPDPRLHRGAAEKIRLLRLRLMGMGTEWLPWARLAGRSTAESCPRWNRGSRLCSCRALSRIRSRCPVGLCQDQPECPNRAVSPAGGHGDATAVPAGRRVQDADPAPGSSPAVHSTLHSSACTGPDPAPLPSAEPLALSGAPHHRVLGCPCLSAPLQLAPHMQTPPQHPVTAEGTSSTRSTLEKLCFPLLQLQKLEAFLLLFTSL